MVKIQSYSDIITNSSSELFVIKSELKKHDLCKIISKHFSDHEFPYGNENSDKLNEELYNCASGWGGGYELEKLEQSDMDLYELNVVCLEDKEELFKISIDWKSYATIKWIKETFEIIKEDY